MHSNERVTEIAGKGAERGVPSALGAARGLAEQTHQLALKLEERLGAVLLPPSPGEARRDSPRAVTCGLAEAISEVNMSQGAAYAVLQSILQRLDI